jgi:peptidoglycan hydrolase-like protein with peptidoglycan-binding domain
VNCRHEGGIRAGRRRRCALAATIAVQVAFFIPAAGFGSVRLPSMPDMRPVESVALVAGTEPAGVLREFLPPSPLVSRLQEILTALGLYSGPIDGRATDATIEAIRGYQRQAGLEPDGVVSEELLARMELADQAQQLVARLDAIRARQIETARSALASRPETRDLVSGRRGLGAADPTRDASGCLERPTVSCLVAEAVETAKAIPRAAFRDWILGDVVETLSAIGDIDAAFRAAGQIEDPRLIVAALRRISTALSDAGRTAEALAVADMISDRWAELAARLAAIRAFYRAQDTGSVRTAVKALHAAAVGGAGEDAASQDQAVDVLSRLAEFQFAAGDTSGAGTSLELASTLLTARARANDSPVKPTAGPASHAAATLASAFAKAGEFQRADAVLGGHEARRHWPSVVVDIVAAHAAVGDSESAAAAAAAIEDIRYRATAYLAGAFELARIRETAAAAAFADEVLKAVESLPAAQTYAKADALARLSELYLHIDRPDAARMVIRRITDGRLRAHAWWGVVRFDLDRNRGVPSPSFADAISATADIASPVDRAWTLGNAAVSLALGDHALSDELARRALDAAIPIANAWGRALALVRIADVVRLVASVSSAERRSR